MTVGGQLGTSGGRLRAIAFSMMRCFSAAFSFVRCDVALLYFR